MEATRRRARRLPPADRRQQLLACAVQAFAARGIGRASHADVARSAAVAVPTVFAYFKNRAVLVHAVLEAVARYFDEMAERFHHPGILAPAALLQHAVAFATSVETDPDYARVLLEWSTAIREDVWPLFLRFQDGMLQRFVQTILRGQRETTIASEVDAETAALILIGSSWMVIQMRFTHWSAERVHRFLLAELRGAIGADAVARALA